MTERSMMREEERETMAKDFLAGYRLCEDMLHLRKYERKRGGWSREEEESVRCEELLSGSVGLWRARMEEIKAVLGAMHNGRDKLMLYYHYIRGESIEHASDLLGVSRRTGYRMHKRGLTVIGAMLERIRMKR